MLLEVRNLQVSYGGIRAVKGIDLQVTAGELVCLIGANGAGKSSSLRALCRLIPARADTMAFAGTDLRAVAAH